MTERAVPYGIAIPQVFPDEPVDIGLVRAFVTRAEGLGYHSLWVQERVFGSASALEPLALLSYAAALTRSVRLGTAMLIASIHNPVHLAKQLSTLDQISDGRLIVGVSLGGRPTQYQLFGGPSERRVRHFVESVEVMKALWERPRASYDGDFWRFDGLAMEPRPVQQPHPPIWFGGRHPDGLRRAARLADGWMGAGSTATDQFRDHVGVVRSALDEAGRDPATFPIAKRVYVALDDDEARAEERLRTWFGRHYGDADMASRVSVWGPAQRCIEGLAEVVESGAQMLMLNPAFDHMEHLEALASDIMPRLGLPEGGLEAVLP